MAKKIDEIKINGNQGRGKSKKKWMEVIRKDMKACSVNEDMVSNKEEGRGKIWVADPCVG